MTHSPKQTPWFAVLADDDPAWRVRAEGGLLVADLEASDFTVQTDADHAHLIAAAPELYEALKAARDELAQIAMHKNLTCPAAPHVLAGMADRSLAPIDAALSKARPSNGGEAHPTQESASPAEAGSDGQAASILASQGGLK